MAPISRAAARSPRCAALLRRAANRLCVLLAALAVAAAAPAQNLLDETTKGVVRGRVIDVAADVAIEGVTVTLFPVAPAAEGATERSAVTDSAGAFDFRDVPAGSYQVRYRKPGRRDSALENVVVVPDQETRADFRMPPAEASGAAPGEPVDIEEFVVVATPTEEILAASRMSSDQLLNTLNAEEIAKFAASDVADALKFVAGVNVVEGQFAIIRGLEDRYSSTLYNFAPVPSPDPHSQSVQLDLFPSDVVGDLVVAKTFGPNLPGNSAGGSINILTNVYPEELELKVSSGTGFEQYAKDRFLRYNEGSPMGWEEGGLGDVLESDLGVSFGGPFEVFEREIRFKGLFTREIDFRTAEGFQESREPAPSQVSRVTRPPRGQPVHPPRLTRSGDLSLGELSLSGGRFGLTESERTQQTTGYGGLGFEIDPDGDHQIDASYFYTKKEEETVQLFENGYIPNFDYGVLAERQANGEDDIGTSFNDFATQSTWVARTIRSTPDAGPTRGPLWYSNFDESASFQTDRDLRVFQINGDHHVEWVEGLHFDWAANKAKTTQTENALGTRFFFEPDDLAQTPPTEFPVLPDDLGEGRWAINGGIVLSTNDIEEKQDFGRLDGDYTVDLSDFATFELRSGGWHEKATREVSSTFLENPTISGSSQLAVIGDSPQELGQDLLGDLDQQEDGRTSVSRDTTTEAERKIKAWHVGGKLSLFEQLDLLGGVRHEHIFIQSLNDPFIPGLETARFGAPATFPEVYILFDRLDNIERGEINGTVSTGTFFNDEILGIDVPVDPETGFVDLLDRESIDALVNGTIDEKKFLPSASFAYRPIEGLAIRGAYSETIARPSFREMGFYVSVEPATDDLVVGNPQLQLSEVTSWDGRVEYTFGAQGDLVAVSGFYKKIGTPIESIVLRNPINFESSSQSLYRTFFNNPNDASLWGFEIEARKALDFIPRAGFLRYFSIGGNYTYIDAEVDRTEAELARAGPFFGLLPGDDERFEELEPKRRLFNQPEWIANVDVTFDQPDWGTKATLAFFAISNVLDAAGTAFVRPDGIARDYTLDRYIDSYHQLDFVLSQRLWSGLVLRGSVKNITNSTRAIVYDPDQTDQEISERAFRIGRDYSISLSYTFSF